MAYDLLLPTGLTTKKGNNMQSPIFMSAEDFKRTYFGNSKHPAVSTIRRWLANGELPSRRIGKLLFLDVAAFEARGDPLLEKIIRHESRTP